SREIRNMSGRSTMSASRFPTILSSATVSITLSVIATCRTFGFSMKSDFGRYIDHTLLRPIGTTTDIRKLCTEAVEYGMAAVCIVPSYIPMARDLLKGTRVKIATVIAFPFGVTFTEIKEAEMRASAARGADEMDFVINIAALKSGDDRSIEEEMEYLTAKSRTLGVHTKYIIETAYLTDDEKIRACKIANRVKPDFMKTSTGY